MQTRWLLVLGAVIAGVLFGCGDGEEVDAASVFDSDVPHFSTPGYGVGGTASDGGAGGGLATGGTTSGGSGGNGGAEKAIEEADIIQLQGTRLYALSKYGGLSVIDVAVKDQLKLLGRYELSGEPSTSRTRRSPSSWTASISEATGANSRKTRTASTRRSPSSMRWA